MSASKVIPDHAKDRFWSVVKVCLVEFHDMGKQLVGSKVHHLRKTVEKFPEERMELFYHSEPFDVACRIAKHSISVDKHLSRYLEIRDQRKGRGLSKTE